MKKYLFIELGIRNGEYEYEAKSLHISTCKNIWFTAYMWAIRFYAGNPYRMSKKDDCWYFYGGEVAVEVNKCEEITEAEYKVLRKFI